MTRQFTDADGLTWEAVVVSAGRTSAYLNPKVHRPIVQFTCLDRTRPRRYAGWPKGRDPRQALDDAELVRLLRTARTH